MPNQPEQFPPPTHKDTRPMRSVRSRKDRLRDIVPAAAWVFAVMLLGCLALALGMKVYEYTLAGAIALIMVAGTTLKERNIYLFGAAGLIITIVGYGLEHAGETGPHLDLYLPIAIVSLVGAAALMRRIICCHADAQMQIQSHTQALRENQNALQARSRELERMALAVKMSADGIVVADMNGAIIEANNAAKRMYGVADAGDLIGKNAFTLIPDRERVTIEMVRLMHKKSLENLEYHTQTPDGRDLFAEVSVGVMENAEGQPVGFVSVHRDITERKQAEKIQTALYRITQAANVAQTLSILFDLSHNILSELMNAENCIVALYDATTEVMHFPYFSDESGSPPEPRKLEQGPLDYLIRHDLPLLFTPENRETFATGEGIVFPDIFPAHWLGVPLKTTHGKIIGGLAVYNNSTVPYNDIEQDLLVFISSQVATSIQRIQAEVALHAREQFHILLNDITRTALETLDSPTMLKTLAKRLVEVLNADGCFFALWDQSMQRPFFPTEDWGSMWRVPAEEDLGSGTAPLTRAAIQARCPVIVEDVFATPYISENIAERLPARSLLVLPLIAADQKLGAVSVGFAEPHLFTPDEVQKGEQTAQQIALAMAKARLVEALHRRNQELTLLNHMGRELIASPEMEHVTQQLLQSATEAVNAEGASVWLWDEETSDELICRADFHKKGESPLLNIRLHSGQGFPGWVAQTGESVVIADITETPQKLTDVDRIPGFETRSLVTVPLRLRDAIIGALQVVNKQRGHFDQDDRALIETLASSAAIAIDNARLIDALRQRTVELERRNEELDAYAHTVAHDLKNPLNVLTTYASWLMVEYETMTPAEITQGMETVFKGARKMSDIINNLLLLASAHKAKVTPIELAMGEVIDEALLRLETLIDEQQATIQSPKSWPVAIGYAPWVEEIWANYISNAIKYGGNAEAGIHPQVELGFSRIGAEPAAPESIAAKIQNPNAIVFWVRDNGRGLTPEEQSRLFTTFERLGRLNVEGHGLGLSIVLRIVERLGGQVGAESTPGQGSTFWFTLPEKM
ncbi:MAG: GAF domain-containing protein [Anaerolineae bacterium]|nr:GAF domain-containing protein [Anaerolineae bacterium]